MEMRFTPSHSSSDGLQHATGTRLGHDLPDYCWNAVMSIQPHQPGIEVFDAVVDQLPDFLDQLLAAPAASVSEHPEIPNVPGIYLFSEDDQPIYVGQSRKLKQRLGKHTNPSGKHNSASFAFLIARTEAEKAGIDTAQFRKQLERDQQFIEHFTAAKLRVSEMDVRWIELEGEIARTIFEVYASLALDTLVFNSWETH